MSQNINTTEWNEKINILADEAAKGCGCSHDVYVSKFSRLVDERIVHFDEATKRQIILLAVAHDYATENELEEQAKWNKENGCCSHGLDPNYCPAGCGDIY